jgi:hypothetical protein
MTWFLFTRPCITILAIASLFTAVPADARSQGQVASTVAISELDPTSAVAGSASLELVVRGAGFTRKSQIRINGEKLATKFTSANEVRAQLAASSLATPGSMAVHVFTPGDGSTRPLTLAIVAGGAAPVAADTEPPRLENFPSMTVPASSASGVGLTFRTPFATDNSGSATVTCQPLADVILNLPVGVTSVTCTARDPSGNTATLTFTITVTPPPATQ